LLSCTVIFFVLFRGKKNKKKSSKKQGPQLKRDLDARAKSEHYRYQTRTIPVGKIAKKKTKQIGL